jgi:hypothetical protein
MFSVKDVKLSSIFKEIESSKKKHGIIDWGFGQSTLEDVFIKLIDDDDASAT